MTNQEKLLLTIANKNYELFYRQGYATAGHNGPHGHPDTPARNTAHYLIIYLYLFKKLGEKKYLDIATKFVNFLCDMQSSSLSGAVQCMTGGNFDKINGLIGQAWIIEALIYYYEIIRDDNVLNVAKKIFYSQEYDYAIHLWKRIELNGENIDIDPTSNHQVWFAACSYKLAEYCKDDEIDRRIFDFLSNGTNQILNVYDDGLLHHNVKINHRIIQKLRGKQLIKKILSPFKFINPIKFDHKYIEYGYHVFDLYGFTILKEKYADLPLFNSKSFNKAIEYAKDYQKLNRVNGTFQKHKNIYFYSYNSPAFEWAYVAKNNGFYDALIDDDFYEMQKSIMYNTATDDYSLANPDINTWNARAYEYVRFLDI